MRTPPGAARAAGVRFWLSDEELHHTRAMRQAIARARSRAEVMADATGATLGDLVRLGTPAALSATLGLGDGTNGVVERHLMEAPLGSVDDDRGGDESVILPGAITLSVTVHAAWEARQS